MTRRFSFRSSFIRPTVAHVVAMVSVMAPVGETTVPAHETALESPGTPSAVDDGWRRTKFGWQKKSSWENPRPASMENLEPSRPFSAIYPIGWTTLMLSVGWIVSRLPKPVPGTISRTNRRSRSITLGETAGTSLFS